MLIDHQPGVHILGLLTDDDDFVSDLLTTSRVACEQIGPDKGDITKDKPCRKYK